MPYLTGDTIPSSERCKVVRIPDDLAFLDALNGQLYELTLPENWETDGAVSAEDMAAKWDEIYDLYVAQECVELSDFVYPKQCSVFPNSARLVTGNGLTLANQASQIPAFTVFVTTPAINNRIRFPIFIKQGVWDFKVRGIRNTNQGKVKIYTDEQSSPLTEFDWYGALNNNYEILYPGIPFVNDGNHTIDFEVYDKNASSSAYGFFVTFIEGVWTGDYP